MVYFVYLFGDYVDSGYLVVLGEEGGYAKTYVAGAGYGYADFFEIVHGFRTEFLQR